tara:strand:- start:149 stop:691 length:543 start_codon:yes stop_codon:yes gene_type:complete
MVTISLLLISKSNKILIDTGNGTKSSEKLIERYNIDNSKYSVENSLSKYCYEPEDISDVICTHLHFDYAGGNTCFDGHKIVPTFPNVKYWMPKLNWNPVNSPCPKDSVTYIEPDCCVFEENNMIKLVEGKTRFIDGVDNFITNGHTCGLMHTIISDEKDTTFFGADIFPTVAHLQVLWHG